MTDAKKWKEFWVQDRGYHYEADVKQLLDYDIHVIEYSAYEQLQAENERLKLYVISGYEQINKELQAENELLKHDHKLMLGWLTLLTKDEFVDDYQFAFKQTKKTAKFLIEQLNHKEGA